MMRHGQTVMEPHIPAYVRTSWWTTLVGEKMQTCKMPGPKAGPQLYVPDVSRSPTTQPEGPTVGSQSPPPLLTPDQPTSLAKACTEWGSCLRVCKRSSWP